MALDNLIRKDLLKVFLLTLASLFLIPFFTLVFSDLALRKQDADFLYRAEAKVATDVRLSDEDKVRARAFYRSHLLSSACEDQDPRDQAFHDQVCEPYSMHWQFHWAERAAGFTLMLGGGLLATGWGGAPLVACGLLKIGYDLALLGAFRHVKPDI